MERRIADYLARAFSSEMLAPHILASMTSMLFTDSMNERLQRWFHLHWSKSYPLDGDEDGPPAFSEAGGQDHSCPTRNQTLPGDGLRRN